jgi:hypothetical protein
MGILQKRDVVDGLRARFKFRLVHVLVATYTHKGQVAPVIQAGDAKFVLERGVDRATSIISLMRLFLQQI